MHRLGRHAENLQIGVIGKLESGRRDRERIGKIKKVRRESAHHKRARDMAGPSRPARSGFPTPPMGFLEARKRRYLARNPSSLSSMPMPYALAFLPPPRDNEVHALAIGVLSLDLFARRSGSVGTQIGHGSFDPMLPRPDARPVSSPQGLPGLAAPLHRLVIVWSIMEANDVSVFRQSELQEDVLPVEKWKKETLPFVCNLW